MKYVINKCFGGFRLSPRALKLLHEWGCPGVAVPIEEYGFTPENVQDELKNEYSLYTFSDDLSCVLSDNMFSPCCFNPSGRANPYLVNVVTELGKEANGCYASLVIVDVPDGVEVEITEYDGMESIREASRYFG